MVIELLLELWLSSASTYCTVINATLSPDYTDKQWNYLSINSIFHAVMDGLWELWKS